MYKHIPFLFIFTIIPVALLSQILTESPYSKLGFGLVENTGNVVNGGMGGAATTFYKRNTLNIHNPAAISSLDTLSFAMEFGVKSHLSYITMSGLSKSVILTNPAYFAFGFRAIKRWSAAFSVTPLSSRGYKIIDRETIPVIGEVSKYYLGSGGINKLQMINSFDITQNLSIGIATDYLFGKLEETNTLIFPNLTSSNKTQEGIKQHIRDFSYTFGLHSRVNTTETERYEIGLSFSPKFGIAALETAVKGTTNGTNLWSVDNNIFIDTMKFYERKPVTLDKPMTITIGLGKTAVNKYSMAIDYTYSAWGATNHINTTNSHLISAGYSFVPQWNSATNYSRRITYRFGAYYESSNIKIGNTTLHNVGLATGLGLPIRRGLYSADIDLQIGQMGAIQKDKINDYYAKLSLKFRFSETWFYKPKYD